MPQNCMQNGQSVAGVTKEQGEYIMKAIGAACRSVGVVDCAIAVNIEPLSNYPPAEVAPTPDAARANTPNPIDADGDYDSYLDEYPGDEAGDLDTELEPAVGFKIGDVVTLGGAGPAMTVTGIDATTGAIQVAWMNKNFDVRGAHFQAEVLVEVPF